MASEDKLQNQQNNPVESESNAPRDRDHGNMNNGEIGGSMGTKESSNDQGSDTANDGSKSGNGARTDGSMDNAGSGNEGHATGQ